MLMHARRIVLILTLSYPACVFRCQHHFCPTLTPLAITLTEL